MCDKKEELKLPPLKTIEDILSELDFFSYSTRIRNLAYQIQLLEFQQNLLVHYNVYGGLRNSLIRQFVIVTTNIVEYLLFISLWQIYGKDPKPNNIPKLIGQAKRKQLIERDLARDLNDINKLRLMLHPSKQLNELDVKVFNDTHIDSCMYTLHKLIAALGDYFKPKNIEVETPSFECPYEAYNAFHFLDKEWCPYCWGYGSW
jgi:hypothetical protein